MTERCSAGPQRVGAAGLANRRRIRGIAPQKRTMSHSPRLLLRGFPRSCDGVFDRPAVRDARPDPLPGYRVHFRTGVRRAPCDGACKGAAMRSSTSAGNRMRGRTTRERLGIDIAVDLKGLHPDHRAGILRSAQAPVQVNYLGFPGNSRRAIHGLRDRG